jgi:predicted exporter
VVTDLAPQSTRGPRFWLALAAVVGLLVAFVWIVAPRLRVETNLLALLPSTAENRVQLDAVKKFADRSSRELVFVVGTASREDLRATGLAFAAALNGSGAFARVDYVVDNRFLTAARAERAMRSALLSTRQRAQLEHDVPALERDALRAAYTPLGFTRPFGISDDPLGLASAAFAEALPGTGKARLEGDILVVHGEGRHWTVVRATTAQDPYRTETQETVTAAVEAARAAAQKVASDAQISGSGVILHAAAAASKAQAEVATFGGVDLLAVVILIVLVFRQLRPLLVTLVTLGIATVAAICACQLVFGQVHILTLTFGTSLIGVSVDYALHYFVNRMPARTGETTPHNLVPALILGCTTTVAGYMTLLVAPIPGLRQIALFSAVGLATACAVVILLYPGALGALSVLLRRLRLERERPPRAVPRWVARLAAIQTFALLPRRAAWLLLCVVAALTIWGLSMLTPRDDVRALQRPPPELIAAEKRVRTLLGVGFDTRFVLVTAATPELVLQRLEALESVFAMLEHAGKIKGHMSVSPSLVSLERQARDRALLVREVYGDDGALVHVMQKLGFAPDVIAARRASFAAAQDQALTPERWLESPLSAPVRHLWLGALGADDAAVILLDGNTAPEAVRAAVESLSGVRYVDQVENISSVLGEYRRIASWLMLVVVGVMLGCLLVFYRSGAAVRTALPAATGLALTLATLGFLHEPVNLFHVLSLLLVLGLGVDYAIILREGRSQQAVLAVFLSMTTTLISFGLLGFSSVPFVRSIGITVALGVAFTFLIAIAAKPRQENGDIPRFLAKGDAPPAGASPFARKRGMSPFSTLCLALLLGGCATQLQRAPAKIPLAPPAALSARSASQVIHAIYGPRAMTLSTAIQLDAAGLKVVGLTATGLRLFTVSWDGSVVSAQKSAFVPDKLDPERVLADVQLALWPLTAVQGAFGRAGLEVTEPFAGVRRLRRGDALIAEVHYTTPDPWNGRLWFVNFEFDYSLTIDTTTAAPN